MVYNKLNNIYYLIAHPRYICQWSTNIQLYTKQSENIIYYFLLITKLLMSNSTDTTSFTVNFSVPRESIREYFDGLAKVEIAKHGSSINWDNFLSALTLSASALAPMFMNMTHKPTESDYFYESDDSSDVENSSDVPVQSSTSQCEVDIRKSKVGDQIKTIVELVGARGANGKEILDQLISALSFIRDNDSEESNDNQVKQQAESCCPTDTCDTTKCSGGVCVRSDKGKDKESDSASITEDSFSPDLSKKVKKVKKIIKKPVYQESENSGVATDLATAIFANIGLKMDGEKGSALKDIFEGFGANLLDKMVAMQENSSINIPVPVAEKKPEGVDKTEPAKVDKTD